MRRSAIVAAYCSMAKNKEHINQPTINSLVKFNFTHAIDVNLCTYFFHNL
jgi:hypothetical protein